MSGGTITALQAQASDPQRVNVFIDDVFALGVSLATVTTEQLFVGKQLDAAAHERLSATEHVDKAIQAGLRALERRARSASELRTILKRKEFSTEAITAALERLSSLGMIDDAAFARQMVASRQSFSPRGPGALRDTLQRRGLGRETIAAVLADEELVGDSAVHAEQVARQALGRYADALDRMTFVRRFGSYLQRRGFGFETVRPILDTLWAEISATRDDTDTADE